MEIIVVIWGSISFRHFIAAIQGKEDCLQTGIKVQDILRAAIAPRSGIRDVKKIS